MRKFEVGDYYYFGTEVRYLQDAKVGMSYTEKNFIRDNIVRFLKGLDELGLKVTKRASFELLDLVVRLDAESVEFLSEGHCEEIESIMGRIRHTLDAEISEFYAFVTTPKRFDVEKLYNDVGDFFAPGVFEKFVDIAKLDFSEAGKCIVFERPTSAAFHVLRATEANLRYYYKTMIRQKRISSEMWGPIVKDLMVKNKTKKHTVLNNHLDNIRLSFRNPTQHPEANYDIHEVQDLFSLCIDVNNRMIKVLKDEGQVS